MTVGEVINDVIILKINDTGNINTTKLEVKCLKCGRERIIGLRNINRGKALGTYHGKFCSESISDYSKHFYEAWCNMKTRTKTKYKQRNIKCTEFECFADFYDNLYESYCHHVKLFGENNTTLERVNNDLDYSTENCIWITKYEQANNKSNTLFLKCIKPNGDEFNIKNLKRFCEQNNIDYDTVYMGVHRMKHNNHYKHRASGIVFYGM